MDPNFSQALKFLRQVQTTTIAGDGRRTYDEFRKTLNQYRQGKIDSSGVISTVQTLFHNHQTLIDAFKPFLPRHRPPPEDPKLRSCLDFINRVGSRFDGGRAYRKFLDCMCAYSRAEITPSDLRLKVVGLFGNNDDLLHEFLRFFPEPRDDDGEREGSKKRRRIDREAEEYRERDVELRQPERNGRASDEEIAASAPRRTERRRLKKSEMEEKAAARKVMHRDNCMEDWMCEIDVMMGNLESCIKKALSIYEGLYVGRLSPADVRQQFTPLNLGCIRRSSSSGGKFLEDIGSSDRELVKHALNELVEVLMKKKEEMERERVKAVQNWKRIRSTNSTNRIN